MKKNKSIVDRIKSTVCVITILAGLYTSVVHSASFNYTPTSIVGTLTDNGCSANPIEGVTATFNIPDDFSITDVNVGANITHEYRGDLVMTLTRQDLPTLSRGIKPRDGSNGEEDFNVTMNDASTNDFTGVHDMSSDFLNFVDPDPDGSLVDFNNTDAIGIRTFFVCNRKFLRVI